MKRGCTASGCNANSKESGMVRRSPRKKLGRNWDSPISGLSKDIFFWVPGKSYYGRNSTSFLEWVSGASETQFQEQNKLPKRTSRCSELF